MTKAPWELTQQERSRIKAWCSQRYPTYYRGLQRMWVRCRDYHLSNGILRADWEATFRNWIRKQVEIDRRQAANGDVEAARRQRPSLRVV